MILETSRKNRENKYLINDLVGKSFNFLKIFKMKGISTEPLIIEASSPNMKPYLNTPFDATYVNIEVRPMGILAKIKKGNKIFTWVIPFDQLDIEHGNYLNIRAQDRYIKFRDNKTFQDSKGFFDKLVEKKYGNETNYGSLPNNRFKGKMI